MQADKNRLVLPGFGSSPLEMPRFQAPFQFLFPGSEKKKTKLFRVFAAQRLIFA